ncbi:MAG: hypothetical protein KAG97_09820 [Victivallales bacterium]|nr:hypothetical protein [Victivallales bacterium]
MNDYYVENSIVFPYRVLWLATKRNPLAFAVIAFRKALGLPFPPLHALRKPNELLLEDPDDIPAPAVDALSLFRIAMKKARMNFCFCHKGNHVGGKWGL